MGIPLAILSIVAGFIGLIWSAERLVLGASTTAGNLGVRPIVIGLTIVAFGTSAPEIFTSGAASLRGVPSLAVGNALGSNIANIGLVLGITALVRPVIVPPSLLRHELPALLLVTGACLLIFLDLSLDWLDGVALLAILSFLTWRVMRTKTRDPESQQAEEAEAREYIARMSTPRALGLMLLALALMIASANILVSGASAVALALGVSELVIGLTIVAIGTSLPELATSLASVFKGHHDLAVGNIVGSNILNLLLVLPVPAFLATVTLDMQLLWRDYGTMVLLTAMLAAVVVLSSFTGRRIGRVTGAVLLLVYLAYTAALYY